MLLSSLALPASAATDVHARKSGVVEVSTERVIEVLSTDEMCDEGCRYYGPHIEREVKLKHGATSTSFYKWTHISGVKTVKFFKHFSIKHGPVTTITVRTLTEHRDAALIEELEKKTGLPHEPLFDVSTASYSIEEKGSHVEIEAVAMTRVSGLVTVLSTIVRKEMNKSLDAMFENFTR